MEGSVHWKLYKPFWWGRFWLWDIAACMLPCRIQRTWSFMNYRVAKPLGVHQFFRVSWDEEFLMNTTQWRNYPRTLGHIMQTSRCTSLIPTWTKISPMRPSIPPSSGARFFDFPPSDGLIFTRKPGSLVSGSDNDRLMGWLSLGRKHGKECLATGRWDLWNWDFPTFV